MLVRAPEFDWAFRIGAGSKDVSRDITMDKSGNLIVTGYFTGTVDFDPGPNTMNLVSNLGTQDVFLQKLDANGNLIWANHVGNSSSELGMSVRTDSLNNIYVLGQFRNTVDFDPGPGTFNLTAATNSSDVFMQKLDSNGNFIWAKKILTGSDIKTGFSFCIDNAGSIYTAGYFEGKVDFDPNGSFDMCIRFLTTRVFAPPYNGVVTPEIAIKYRNQENRSLL